MDRLRTDMDKGYQQNALNCWIAALLYLVTLCFSAQQFWMNNKSTYRETSLFRHGWDKAWIECNQSLRLQRG